MYNREKAVAYALKYGETPNNAYVFYEDNGDCTNFVSQCLRAGNCADFYSTSCNWWYRKGAHSQTWSVAHSLYWCLKNRFVNNDHGLKAKEVYNTSQLEIGDIIQYEKNGGKIYHSAIITFISDDKKRILITQHSANLVNISYIKKNAKPHFMKILNN